jgi:hypothetical protein
MAMKSVDVASKTGKSIVGEEYKSLNFRVISGEVYTTAFEIACVEGH